MSLLHFALARLFICTCAIEMRLYVRNMSKYKDDFTTHHRLAWSLEWLPDQSGQTRISPFREMAPRVPAAMFETHHYHSSGVWGPICAYENLR